MKKTISDEELSERIRLNFHRISDSAYYQMPAIFSPIGYDWPGDTEGRVLLSYVSHYKISGQKIPSMEPMIEAFPHKVNERGYLGAVYTDVLFEQQLSGHSWVLRGLCETYEQFGNESILRMIDRIVENLYMPTKGRFSTYPTDRTKKDGGGVVGNSTDVSGGWLLSSDIGCAFMSIDGLSHVYKITKDPAVKELLDEMIDVYLSIDKVTLRVQTHCTLTAGRGMMRLYGITGEKRYLDGAKAIYELYVFGGGMTYTYQNLNWWGRPDTWTEPCAVIDSLMLALELYQVTKDETTRKTAARIYHNGFPTLQRDNGGAGTDTIVTDDSPWDYLGARMYEACSCCTMRLSEGLWYIREHKDLLYAETEGKVTKDENGLYRDGDILYALPDEALLPYAGELVSVDGMELTPIVKYYKVPKDIIMTAKQKILFK